MVRPKSFFDEDVFMGVSCPNERLTSLQASIYINQAYNFRFPGIKKVTLIVSKCDSLALICTTRKLIIPKRFPGTSIKICKGHPIAVSLQIGGFLTESENPLRPGKDSLR